MEVDTLNISKRKINRFLIFKSCRRYKERAAKCIVAKTGLSMTLLNGRRGLRG